MKNIIVLLLITFSFATSLKAQEDNIGVGDFKFGFELSPGVEWLSTNSSVVAGNGAHLGLKLGVIVEYFFAENYSIETGVSLNINQGGKLRFDKPGNFLPKSELSESVYNTGTHPLPEGTIINYKLQYLEIPIALKMRTQQFGNFRYYANIPILSTSFLTKARGTITSTNLDELAGENIKKDMRFMTMSWGLGGGAEYMLSESTAIIIGVYYKQSFLDVTRNKGVYIKEGIEKDEDSKGNLNSITFKLGVVF